MNRLLTVLLLLIMPAWLPAQDPSGIHFRQFPPGLFNLDRGWRFHSGDDPHWADPGFNDSTWKEVSLSDISSYMPAFSRNDIGWFRCKLYIDSPGTTGESVIALSQLGASEVYLNGNIFLHLGAIVSGQMLISDNPHFKPFLIHTNPIDTLNIAIRFASTRFNRLWLLRKSNSLPLSVMISNWNRGLDKYETILKAQRIPVGLSYLTVGVGVIFLMLYIFNAENTLILLFAAFSFLLGTMAGLQFQLSEGNLDMSAQANCYFLWQLIDRLCSALVLSILTRQIFQRVQWYQLALMFYFVIFNSTLIYLAPPDKLSDFLLMTGRLWLVAELVRIAYFGFLRRRYITGALAVATAVLHFSFVLVYFGGEDFTPVYYHFNHMMCFGALSICLLLGLNPVRRVLNT
jgi:hypothetical protein